VIAISSNEEERRPGMSQTLQGSPGTRADRGPVGRRFTIADGAILVVATAAGFALIHVAVPEVTPRVILDACGQLLSGAMPGTEVAGSIMEISAILVVPCLSAWTLAVAVLGLRRPRPRLRRLSRRPGVMACLAAVPALGLAALTLGPSCSGLFGRQDRGTALEISAGLGTLLAGSAVLSCWLTMALAGRWRPERSWIDRAGRLLGVVWVGMLSLFFCLVALFWPF
jgi:hypothetical protein